MEAPSMSRSLFWLSDEAWQAIEPHLPRTSPERASMIVG
jgi:transposase